MAMSTVNRQDLMELKNLSIAKKTVDGVKKIFPGWETSFASYTSDRGLVPKTQRMKNLNVMKANTWIKKWVMELSRGLKRRNQMARKPLKELGSLRHSEKAS